MTETPPGRSVEDRSENGQEPMVSKLHRLLEETRQTVRVLKDVSEFRNQWEEQCFSAVVCRLAASSGHLQQHMRHFAIGVDADADSFECLSSGALSVPVLRLKLRLGLNLDVMVMAQIWRPREQQSLLQSKTLRPYFWHHHQHHHHNRHFVVITTTSAAEPPDDRGHLGSSSSMCDCT